jgi:hypothetical protein
MNARSKNLKGVEEYLIEMTRNGDQLRTDIQA